MTRNKETIFRPHLVGHFAWWLAAPAIWCVLYFGFRFVEMPAPAIYFVYLLGIGVLLSAIYVSTSYCKITEEFLETGLLFRTRIRWNEIEKWTRWGENGSLFVKSRSGKILGTGSWAFYGDRVDRLENMLIERYGEQATGDDGVLPKFLDIFIDGMIRSAG